MTRSVIFRLLVVGAMVATAACGTRLPDEDFVRAGAVVVSDDGAVDGFDAGGATVDGASTESSATVDEAATGGSVDVAGPTDSGGDEGLSAAGPAAAVAPGAAPASSGAAATGGNDGGPNQASDVGITADSVKVGTIIAENGVLGDAFAPVARGIRAWVGRVNETGGINGRKVVLVTCDDREDRARALECARRMVEKEQVFAIVATNTRALGGAAPYLAQQKIPVFGIPITNAFYRWPNFFSAYGAPYVRDGKQVGHEGQLRSLTTGYRWFKENLGASKAAVVAYDIAESAQAGAFIAKGLELEGFAVDQYTVSFAAPSFDQVVADMQRKGTELLFDAMDDGANRRLCDTLSRRGYKVKAKVSTIVVMGQSLGTDYNETCRNVTYITSSSVAYTQTQIPGVKAFRDAYARYQPGQELHQWALDGFALGNMFAEGLGKLGAAPTRAGIIDRFNSLPDSVRIIDGMLLAGAYRPTDFKAERVRACTSISRWQDSAGGWVQAAPFPLCYPDSIQYFTPVGERGD